MTGILGNKAGLHVFQNCDLLLCMGSDFAYTQFYPEDARIIQIDTEPLHIGRRTPVDLGLVGDVAATVKAILPKILDKNDDGFLISARKQWQKDIEAYSHHAESGEDLIHPQTVTHMLDELASKMLFSLPMAVHQ